jgi:spore coat protein U-like protein
MTSATFVRIAFASALLVSSCFANPALSATSAKSTLNVNLEIESGCDFTVTDMDFGIHNAIIKHIYAQATLTIACTPGVSYTVGLDKGAGKDSNEFQRRLTGVKNRTRP